MASRRATGARLVSLLLGAILLLTGGTCIFGHTDDEADTTRTLSVIRSACQISGGVVTLGFGAWHFFVPGLYDWYGYMDPAATELPKAVKATNFFMSASMSIIGAANIAMPILDPEPDAFNTAWLWSMVGLWTARSVFQAVNPQGTLIKGVAPTMLAIFILTDAIFITAAVASAVEYARYRN